MPDLAPLAELIQKLLQSQDGIYALPRKFKISLSACQEGCGQPFINDLGLVATRRSGTWGFRVIGAGSLGARTRHRHRALRLAGPIRRAAAGAGCHPRLR